MGQRVVAFLPSEELLRVAHSADIVALATALGMHPVRETQAAWRVVCPFHQDSEADGGSCHLYTVGRKGPRFQCYGLGCGAHGNAMDLYCYVRGWRRQGKGSMVPHAAYEIHKLQGMGFAINPTFRGDTQALTDAKVFEGFDRVGGVGPFWVDPKWWGYRTPAGERDPEGALPVWSIADKDQWKTWMQRLGKRLRRYWLTPDGKPVPLSFPVEVVEVADLAAYVVCRPGSYGALMVVCGRTLEYFRDTVGKPQLFTGAELAGKSRVSGTLPIFLVRFAVENPLDLMVLKALGVPAVLGVWWNLPLEVVPTSAGIHCYTALLPKGGVGRERMMKTLRREQSWLPREYRMDRDSLLQFESMGEAEEYVFAALSRNRAMVLG